MNTESQARGSFNPHVRAIAKLDPDSDLLSTKSCSGDTTELSTPSAKKGAAS